MRKVSRLNRTFAIDQDVLEVFEEYDNKSDIINDLLRSFCFGEVALRNRVQHYEFMFEAAKKDLAKHVKDKERIPIELEHKLKEMDNAISKDTSLKSREEKIVLWTRHINNEFKTCYKSDELLKMIGLVR